MGIFDKIKSAIWGDDEPAAPEIRTASINQPTRSPTVAQDNRTSETAKAPNSAPPSGSTQSTFTPAQTAATQFSPPPSSSTQHVDIEAVMEKAVKASGHTLNWRTSIVDTMKALNLDSSLSSRKELADELGYTGDKNDSATMNVWLQKALMKKLAENGGKVPAELTD